MIVLVGGGVEIGSFFGLELDFHEGVVGCGGGDRSGSHGYSLSGAIGEGGVSGERRGRGWVRG